MASDELNSYKRKVCELEDAVASKERELKTHADLLRKKEATMQKLSEDKSEAALRAKQMEKR